MKEQVVCGLLLGLNAVQDIRKREILVTPTIAAAVTGVFWNLFGQHLAAAYVLCEMLPGGVLLLSAWLTRGQIGFGDGILVLACAAWTGFPDVLYIVTAGLFFASAGAGVIFILRYVLFSEKRKKIRKAGRNARPSSISVPFAPFLFAAFVGLQLIRR